MQASPTALLINDKNFDLAIEVLAMLVRAGYEVDVISGNNRLKRISLVRDFYLERELGQVANLALRLLNQKGYTHVFALTDRVLKAIVDSSLPESEKLRLLPIVSCKHFGHIYSKVGLSRVFASNEINTPAFQVAESPDQLNLDEIHLGFPFMVKVNSSCGGNGVFKCHDEEELVRIRSCISQSDYPLLIQEFIPGQLLDISAFYQDMKLEYFSYSRIDEETAQYGPSKVRTYMLDELQNAEVVAELERIGRVLGADGFVNIGCLQSRLNGKRYYIEADMRANAWVNHGQYFGHDLADKLRDLNGSSVSPKQAAPRVSGEIKLPHYSRMTFLELLTNRHNVWRYIPPHAPVLRFLITKAKKSIKRKTGRQGEHRV
jgi:hypothetical protein